MRYWFFFFFSSRRRHTRWTGDRSSDVCSSDLFTDLNQALYKRHSNLPVGDEPFHLTTNRSEERRVGKECRYRWSPCHKKKKETTKEGRPVCQYSSCYARNAQRVWESA